MAEKQGMSSSSQPTLVDPTERNIDAENLNFEQLARLYEPNDVQNLSSFDRMSLVGGPTYLVAERGVGKTHILKLLHEVLKKRGDITLWVDQKENPISATFARMKRKHPRENKSILWQIAIIEETSIAIVERYLEDIKDTDFRRYPKDMRKKFAKDFKKGLDDYFDYLRHFRKDDWAKYYRFLSAAENGLTKFGDTARWLAVEVIAETIRRLMSRPVTHNSALDFTVVNPTSNITSDKTDSQLTTERPDLMSRLLQIEEWFWSILRTMHSLDHAAGDGHEDGFTTHLPKSHSAFIIADGLDQTLQPMSHSDILALYLATRYLNRKAAQKEIYNFKMIMGIRAVTYNYYVHPKDPDRGQMYTDIELLTWSRYALKLMMSRRIVESDPPLGNHSSNEILQSKFPERVHYFGHIESALDFIFSVTAFRPRQIIILWRKCAELLNEKDFAFRAVIDEDTLVRGFQQYSLSTLPDDIAEEYSSEYRGLDKLLDFIAANRNELEREVPRKQLGATIDEYIYKLTKEGQKIPSWVGNGSDNVLQVLYQTGIIGVPISEPGNDWANHNHVFEEPNLSVSNYQILYIRPHMWTFLTNIQTEILSRRKYLFALYEQTKLCIEALGDLISAPDKGKRGTFVYEIFKLLSLCYLIKNFAQYSEPVDWRELDKAQIAVLQSWNNMGLLLGLKVGDPQKVHRPIEGIADELQRNIILSGYPSALKIKDISSVNLSDSDYSNAGRTLQPLIDSYQEIPHNPVLQQFSQMLFNSPQSLNLVLGRALDTIRPLMN